MKCIGCGYDHSKHTSCPDGTLWWYGWLLCRICTHRVVAVIAFKPGQVIENIKCPNCDNSSCDPEDGEE